MKSPSCAIISLCVLTNSMLTGSESMFEAMKGHMQKVSKIMDQMADSLRQQQKEALLDPQNWQTTDRQAAMMLLTEDDGSVIVTTKLEGVLSDKIDTTLYLDYRGFPYLKVMLPMVRGKVTFIIGSHMMVVEFYVQNKEQKNDIDKEHSVIQSTEYSRKSMELPAVVDVEDIHVEYDESTSMVTVRMPKSKKKRVTIKSKKR